MKKMKLGIVTAFPPSKITLNEYAYHLVKHFRQNEDVSEIILFTDMEDADINFVEEGCTVKVKKSWSFNSWTNPLKIASSIKKEKPDAVLYNLQFMKFGDKKIPAALGLFAPYITKKMGIPTIVLLHNIMETVDLSSAGFTSNKIKTKVFNWIGSFLTQILLEADKVALTIKNYVDILESKYFANNLILIPHGTFENPEEPSYDLNLSETIKILTFGKFGTYKKVENLIEAFAKVKAKTGKNIELVIAGTDNPNTIGYLDGVKEAYKNIPNITFTGYVEEADVPRIFSESAMVVFPYTSTTGSSGVLHQAGSYGKAVVMPYLGDLGILVKDEGYRGEFFNPNNVDSLAESIEKLVEDDRYRIKLARANYKAATALPMSKISEMYVAEFKELILLKNNMILA